MHPKIPVVRIKAITHMAIKLVHITKELLDLQLMIRPRKGINVSVRVEICKQIHVYKYRSSTRCFPSVLIFDCLCVLCKRKPKRSFSFCTHSSFSCCLLRKQAKYDKLLCSSPYWIPFRQPSRCFFSSVYIYVMYGFLLVM